MQPGHISHILPVPEDGAANEPRALLVAHRAGNSLAELARAEAAGVDLIEADVWWYRGRVEIRHLKTLGPVPVLWDRWKLASGFTPRLRLEELVAASDGTTELMLDLKGGARALPGIVLETMDRLAPGRAYTVSSQWWKQLEPFRGQPHVRVVHSIGSLRMLRALPRALREAPAEAVGINQNLLTPQRLADLQALAPQVFTWTVNDPARARTLLEWGVRGIISDRYEHVQPVIEQHG